MVDGIMALPENGKYMILAPVIRERKGEHLHILDGLRAQGFIRVRVNGLICDLDDTPELDKKKKHSIEVVVDRFKIKEGIEQRLAESLRSEEHTSELQSRPHLVCRLLLEKKKYK